MTPWRKIASKWLVRDRWLSLRADVCEIHNGLILDPYYVMEERDWVHVFAQDRQGRVLVVRQYRYAGNVECGELPGGVVELGETPEDTARRELQEETGYLATKWLKVGQVFANPARQTNFIHIYVAHDLSTQGEQKLDQSEDISIDFLSIADVKLAIQIGEFAQALHIASFYLSLEFLSK
jgi:8-oxo-dGTP pyrophosphatase MutT (NUDIX family)